MATMAKNRHQGTKAEHKLSTAKNKYIDGNFLSAFTKYIKQYPPLPWKAEVALANDPEKEEKLLRHNLYLVLSLAKKIYYRLNFNNGADIAEFIQEGYLGLVTAVEKFEFKRKVKFSTYAKHWIRQKILRFVVVNNRTIEIPVHINTKLSKLKKINTYLEKKFGRKPTLEELAQAMNLTVKKVLALKKIKKPTSLSTPINNDEEDGSCLVDFIRDFNVKSPEEIVIDNIIEEKIWRLVEQCLVETKDKKTALYILKQIYGLATERSLRNIGKELGLSHEWVRQIKDEAFKIFNREEIKKQFEQFL